MPQQLDHLIAQIDKLASFDSGPLPVVSLYLNLQADDRGRDRFDAFLRKELPERTRGYAAEGPERKSLDQDAEKIAAYVGGVPSELNGLALRKAFELGQVDELLLTANDAEIGEVGDELVAHARNTSAAIRFIEDSSLLAPFGGVGALLRWKI